MLSVYTTNTLNVGNRPGAVVRWGEGGNCYIKRKEFKIKLISPPLHKLRMSVLHLVQHAKHRDSVTETRVKILLCQDPVQPGLGSGQEWV